LQIISLLLLFSKPNPENLISINLL